MMELYHDVKGWLHTQKDWLQQAAELLLAKGPLDDNDIMALAEHLKTAAGQTVTRNGHSTALLPGAIPTAELRLKSIGDSTGIENLRPSSTTAVGEGNP